MDHAPWILDRPPDERTAQEPRSRVADIDPHGGHPVWTHAPRLPFSARLTALNLALAASVPAVLGLGYWLHGREDYFQWLFVLFLAGFGAGIYFYFHPDPVTPPRGTAQSMGTVQDPDSTPRLVLLFAVAPPAALFLAVIGGELFAQRAFGGAIFAALTWWAFYVWGARPIEFLREWLLAQPHIGGEVRYGWPRTRCGPDLGALGVLLAIVVLVPIYTSASQTLLVLLAYCGWRLYDQLQRLRCHGLLVKVVPYLLGQADRWGMVYLDYQDVPVNQLHVWAPTDTRLTRRLVALALLAPLYLSLIVGTSFYCPWEWFAAGSLVDFELGWLWIPRHRPAPFEWAWGPLWAVRDAEPRTLSMLAVAIACLLVLFVPALVLFVLYLPRLEELEEIHQLAERQRRQFFE